MNTPSARFIRIKGEKAKINKIRNERGNLTTNTTEIKRIIRDYYKNLHSNKMNNLQEMDRFLEMYNLPRVNQE